MAVFNLRSLELVHWDYWDRMMVPLDRSIVTLTGPNGAGKTTFIDACRTLLSIECSANRDYKRYVRRTRASTAWLRGLVTNPVGPRRVRAFFPIQSEEVTLVCRIRRNAGDWERKYAILAGSVTIEEIEATEVEWIGVREYGTRMQAAGLTPAMRKVLALDQGATDKLSEYTSQQLLHLVFDTYGDQAVLDEYHRSKKEYEEAARELEETERQVNIQKAAAGRLEQEKVVYQEWCKRRDQWVRWESLTLPLLQTQELFSEWLTSNKDRRIARGKLRATRERVQISEEEAAQKVARVTQLKAELQEQREAREIVDRQFRDLRESQGRLEQVLKERERLQSLTTDGSQIDVVAAVQEVAVVRRDLARLDVEQEGLTAQQRDLTVQRDSLASGKQPSIPEADAFQERLRSAGIEHVILANALEVTDTRWQPAIEGVLGALRSMILLTREEDQRAAFELGQAHRYRFLIATHTGPARPATRGRLLSKLRVATPLPGWLERMLDEVHCVETVGEGVSLNGRMSGAVWVTPDGYYREHRGGRFAGERGRFLLGEAGRRAALAAARGQLQDIQARLSTIGTERQGKSARLTQLESSLLGIDAASQLLARTDEFRVAAEEFERCRNALWEKAEQTDAAKRAETALSDALLEASVKASQVTQRLESERESAASAQAEFDTKVDTSRETRRQLKELLRFQPARWRDPAFREKTLRDHGYWESTSDVLRHLMEAEQEWVNERRGSVNELAEFLHQKQLDELNRLETLLSERREMRDRTLVLVDQQRARYINVLKGSASAYQRHVRSLAELAGIEVETSPLAIENNDLSIAQAGLEITFRFDEKAEADLLAGDSSGGQKVMKSMILLIALLMEEDRPAGVVFIDEPFAHLDIFNIDRVAIFLQRTRAQYILTTPITHNSNIYSPTHITLVAQKLKRGEAHAPKICLAIRRGDKGEAA
jgi:chromosome segregation protein